MTDSLQPSFAAVLRMASSEWPHEHPPDTGLVNVFWAARAAARAFSRIAVGEWHSDATRPLSDLGEVVFRVTRPAGTERAVIDVDAATVHAFRGARGRVHITVGAKTDDEAAAVLARFREALPAPIATGNRVTMHFWAYQGCATSQLETIDVCRWPDVSSNYPARTREKLEPLMRPASSTEHGKLVLWLGPPGAGKTYAIRALAWEHRESLVVHYISDPEVFLDRLDYITTVFREHELDDEGEDIVDRRARLLVLEDAGDLLGADAMTRSGHGLARLLNMTDGLLGQACRTRVLITTNEEVGRLHPAVTRPGRCAAVVKFGAFEPAEANAWLAARESRATVDRATTLAELYAKPRDVGSVISLTSSVSSPLIAPCNTDIPRAPLR